MNQAIILLLTCAFSEYLLKRNNKIQLVSQLQLDSCKILMKRDATSEKNIFEKQIKLMKSFCDLFIVKPKRKYIFFFISINTKIANIT